jgi:hypothetical protein
VVLQNFAIAAGGDDHKLPWRAPSWRICRE